MEYAAKCASIWRKISICQAHAIPANCESMELTPKEDCGESMSCGFMDCDPKKYCKVRTNDSQQNDDYGGPRHRFRPLTLALSRAA